MSIREYLADIAVYIGSGVTTLYFTSGNGCYYDGHFYEPRISNPASLKYMMFADGTTMGASQIGFGELVLANADGGLDYLIDGGFSGRSIVIRELIAGATIGLTMACSMEQPTFDNTSMSIRIKDPQIMLNIPVQPNKYGGTNSLPAGIDGTSDIQGKPKPLMYGQCSNVSPVCVNTSRLIYQLHDGALYSISNVYDKGVALAFGTDRANNAAMQSTPPAAGAYDTCLAEGLIRLGSSPFGQVTVDAIQGATAADRTAAQIAKTVALKAISSGDLVAADFTALDALNSAVIGIYITDEKLIPAVLDEVLGSIGGWYGFDSAGKFNVGRLDSPSGTPVESLTNSEILSLDRLATQDEGRGLPTWKVNLGYAKNFTIQDKSSLAGKLLSRWENHSLGNNDSQGIAYGNGMFVAVGSVCKTSPDGITWTTRTIPAHSYVRIAYGNGLFVATYNDTSGVVTSPDGITWTQRTLPSAGGYGVTYGNGLFVTTAYGGSCATSSDGITWTARTMPSTTDWYTVGYGNGLFVALSGWLSASNAAATSTDGITWTTRTLPSSHQWTAITYGNGLFAALPIDSTNVVITSSDGITWTTRTLPATAFWNGISYGDGLFVAIAGQSASNISAVSNDGLSWTLETLPTVVNWSSITYGAGSFVTVSLGNPYSSVYKITPAILHAMYVGDEYQKVTDSDSSIQTKYLNGSQEPNISSLLTVKSAAQTEATRQLNLRKVRRDYIAVKIKRSALSSIPDLGKIINITYPRYGYDSGKLFVLIGFEMFLETDDLTLYLWG